MVRWDDETKVKLLLAIIEHLNPTSLPWDKLANAMGREFTSEAGPNPGPATLSSSSAKPANSTSAKPATGSSSLKRKALSRTTAITDDEEEPTPAKPAKTATSSNPLKRKALSRATVITDDDEEPTPAKAAKPSKPTTSSNPLKRKALSRATVITDDDDDEEEEEEEPAFLAPRSRSVRVKREQVKERGGGGEVFKMEEMKRGEEGVDVENEGLYDDDAA